MTSRILTFVLLFAAACDVPASVGPAAEIPEIVDLAPVPAELPGPEGAAAVVEDEACSNDGYASLVTGQDVPGARDATNRIEPAEKQHLKSDHDPDAVYDLPPVDDATLARQEAFLDAAAELELTLSGAHLDAARAELKANMLGD